MLQELPTAKDRCDRCGARAYIFATNKSDALLMLCAHHGKENRRALEGAGFKIKDYTVLLTQGAIK